MSVPVPSRMRGVWSVSMCIGQSCRRSHLPYGYASFSAHAWTSGTNASYGYRRYNRLRGYPQSNGGSQRGHSSGFILSSPPFGRGGK